MNRKSIYLRVLIFAFFFLVSFGGAFAQTQLKSHKVQNGETLYKLSTAYGITIDQILEYNPGLSSKNLRTGDTILIPVIQAGNSVKENKGSVSIRQTHKIKRKETLFSIAKKYGITINELKAANPEMAHADYKLKKGKKINIPYPSIKKDEQPVQPQKERKDKKEQVAHNGLSTVKIAIMLPFTADATGSNRCIEFYRGFLLAVEKMQNEGKNIEIYAFNEPNAKSNIITILESIRLKNVNLLVGPLYFDHFSAVSRFSKTNKIKTLIPFSSKITEIRNNPYLFLLNAPEEEKHEFASKLFIKNFTGYKAIFIAANSHNERKFTQHLRNKLYQEGFEIGDISTVSTDEQILAVCNNKKQNIFISDGSSDADFEQTMARLIHFNKKNNQISIACFAYPEWQKFASHRRNELHTVNTYIYTNAFFNPWSATTNEIKKKYMDWFHSEIIDTTPRMFMLGYDSGLTFINGLASYGNSFHGQDQNLQLQQSDIAFKKISAEGGYINSSLWFIHYRNDYQIEKVSER